MTSPSPSLPVSTSGAWRRIPAKALWLLHECRVTDVENTRRFGVYRSDPLTVERLAAAIYSSRRHVQQVLSGALPGTHTWPKIERYLIQQHGKAGQRVLAELGRANQQPKAV